MRHVLVLTYYWPPSGGGGVQRWLKFVKYLPQHGWQPIVYAPEGAQYAELDESLLAKVPPGLRVLRRRIFEPRKLFQRFSGADSIRRVDDVLYQDPRALPVRERVGVWLRANLFIPDARMLWIPDSVAFLRRELARSPVDAIVSTGPPHSLHLIALALHEALGVPWIADFRDPWTGLEYFDSMPVTAPARWVHERLERSVLTRASKVVTVSWSWAKELEALGASDVAVVTNGFDEDDFDTPAPALRREFVLSHVGTLQPARASMGLWRAARALADARADFRRDLRIQLVGGIHPSALRGLAHLGLDDNVESTGFVSHAEAIARMRAAQALLLLINPSQRNARGRIPGKAFEYLAARRPILCIAPDGSDTARLVRDASAGTAITPEDEGGMRALLEQWYEAYQRGTLSCPATASSQYSRRTLTRQLSGILDGLVPGAPAHHRLAIRGER